jgi:hypothetical protein
MISKTDLRVFGLLLAASCSLSESGPRYESGLEGLALAQVAPGLVLPGTRLVVEGQSFVDAPFGSSQLVLRGQVDGDGGARELALEVPLGFVDFTHMEAVIDADLAERFGADGRLIGDARIEVDSKIDGTTHVSPTIGVELSFRHELTPVLGELSDDEVIFVNDRIQVVGDGLLLGGGEGTTFARVEGCVAHDGPCQPIDPVDIPVTPEAAFDRTTGSFPFVPAIAGIRAGEFHGSVVLETRHAAGAVTTSGALDAGYRVIEAAIEGAAPLAVSLGQYLEFHGGGFVGGEPGQLTLIQLTGTFTPHGAPPIAIDTVLVPEFVDGHTVRYVVNEDDDLGRDLALRGDGGAFVGTVVPIVSYGDDDVRGQPRAVDLRFTSVKQVVYQHFTPQYVTSLQAFGLRAVDPAIRQRIVDVVERDYATIHVDIRTTEPTDFATYAVVEIGGPDPNGMGLLGYDNTPGKDVGNLRLHDRIGGVNATTQADGFPGFGGVFVDSMFTFSEHPDELAPESPAQDPLFDELFDEFRPDQDGEPVTPEEASGVVVLDGGASCPSDDRGGRIQCAAWVLGSLVGTTISHELGHSLGLANPGGTEVHLVTDKPDRLMEAGGGRSFRERAEMGEGPGMFCDEEYAYLRTILPADEPADESSRPDCL